MCIVIIFEIYIKIVKMDCGKHLALIILICLYIRFKPINYNYSDGCLFWQAASYSIAGMWNIVVEALQVFHYLLTVKHLLQASNTKEEKCLLPSVTLIIAHTSQCHVKAWIGTSCVKNCKQQNLQKHVFYVISHRY